MAYARSGALIQQALQISHMRLGNSGPTDVSDAAARSAEDLLCLGALERLSVTGCEAERGKLIRVMAYYNRPQHHESR